jgi:hypothetical protein
MELIQKLDNVFLGADIVKLQTNRLHDFSINWIKATKQRPYHILFTSGLADKAQNTSENYPEFKHIELYICLPDYWKIEKKDPEHHWPIEWLDRIGAAHQTTESWFGPGDTMRAGNPPKAFSPKMEQDHFILAEPMKIESLIDLELDNKLVKFLSVIPIYREELEYKLRNSAKHFMAKYELAGHTELVDNFRETSQKRSFKYLGLFMVAFLIAAAAVFVWFTDFDINNMFDENRNQPSSVLSPE